MGKHWFYYIDTWLYKYVSIFLICNDSVVWILYKYGVREIVIVAVAGAGADYTASDLGTIHQFLLVHNKIASFEQW